MAFFFSFVTTHFRILFSIPLLYSIATILFSSALLKKKNLISESVFSDNPSLVELFSLFFWVLVWSIGAYFFHSIVYNSAWIILRHPLYILLALILFGFFSVLKKQFPTLPLFPEPKVFFSWKFYALAMLILNQTPHSFFFIFIFYSAFFSLSLLLTTQINIIFEDQKPLLSKKIFLLFIFVSFHLFVYFLFFPISMIS